jgi:hypothetical protein
MTNQEIAQKLREYNEWRRGEGKYCKGGEKQPMEPKELGQVIDLAAKRLENAQLMTEIMFDSVAGDDQASDRALGGPWRARYGKKASNKRRTHEG